jgi:hypothetical protein
MRAFRRLASRCHEWAGGQRLDLQVRHEVVEREMGEDPLGVGA